MKQQINRYIKNYGWVVLFLGLWQSQLLAAQPLLAAGRYHSIYVNQRGRLMVWGDNAKGQLAQDVRLSVSDTPFDPMGLRLVRVVGSGWNHILAATRPTWTRNPALWSWGLGDMGQLGIGPLLPAYFSEFYEVRMVNPVLGDFSTKQFIMLKGGSAHSLALTADGAVWSWGWNQEGQLGLGDHIDRWTAFPIKDLPKTVMAIAAGEDFSLALEKDGLLWAWGRADSGQLGGKVEQESSVPQPQLIEQSRGIGLVSIAAGSGFALALSRDGAVYAWGENNAGQLGREDQEGGFLPDVVRGLPPIRSIAAGGDFALALDQNGALWSWGQNSDGQLGDGTLISRFKPRVVAGAGNVQLMAAGLVHALALRADGVLMGWGEDSHEQLGFHASEGRSTVPRVIDFPSP